MKGVPNLTGVFIKTGKLETYIHRTKAVWRWRQQFGWYLHKKKIDPVTHSVMSNSLQPHGLGMARLLFLWNKVFHARIPYKTKIASKPSKAWQEAEKRFFSWSPQKDAILPISWSWTFNLQIYKTIISFFFLILFLLYFTLQYCIGFAIHWHESTTGVMSSQSWIPLLLEMISLNILKAVFYILSMLVDCSSLFLYLFTLKWAIFFKSSCLMREGNGYRLNFTVDMMW